MLEIVRRLIDALAEAGVAYCQFKSTQRLEASFAGRTDLDLLVSLDDWATFVSTLGALSFKECEVAKYKRYDGVTDWIGMDPDTGDLVHVHAHLAPITGSRFVKEYVFPWGDLLLHSRTIDPSGLPVVAPGVEFVMFLARQVLRDNLVERCLAAMGRTRLTELAEDEFRYLQGRVSPAEVADALQAMFPVVPPPAGASLHACGYAQALEVMDSFLGDRRSLRRIPRRAAAAALFRAWMSYLGGKILKRPSRKTVRKGGAVVAFVGCDGSGKSTLQAAVHSWLKRQLVTSKLYMGTGKGLPVLGANGVGRILVWRAVMRGAATPRKSTASRSEGFTARQLRALYAIVVSRRRLKLLQRARYLANRGAVVLLDRFPQDSVSFENDGWISVGNGSFLERLALRSQGDMYAYLRETRACDLVIVLRVSPEIACSRRPEISLDRAAQKIASLGKVAWCAKRVVVLDADADAGMVAYGAKTSIWALL